MRNISFNFPDEEEISRLIKDAVRELIPELKRQQVLEKPSPKYLTRQEVVEIYHISLVTLHNHTKLGLPSIKIGKRRLYSCEVIEKHFGNKKST